MAPSGQMRERLVIQEEAAATLALASLTQAAGVATATTTALHGYETGDYVTVAGAAPAGYNGKVKITVTGTRTFTYTVSAALAATATGTKTATYQNDAQGGRRTTWATVDTVWAEEIPLRAGERLQLAAIQSDVEYRFRVRARTDLEPKMRLLWTPRWPAGAAQQTLEVNGVLPDEEAPLRFQYLECSRSPRA